MIKHRMEAGVVSRDNRDSYVFIKMIITFYRSKF